MEENFNNIYIIKCGGLYYSQMSIHQKINFKKEATNKNIQTVIVCLRFQNIRLQSFK